MDNDRVAAVFDQIADLLELKGESVHRVRSYRTAAQTLRAWPEPVESLTSDGKRLTRIPGIGESLAAKIREFVHTGHCQRLDDLRRELPGGLTEMLHVPGLGPHRAMDLYRHLGVQSLTDLKQACHDHRVRAVPGFGERTEERICHGIEAVETTVGRMLLPVAAEYARAVEKHLQADRQLIRWDIAGSYRRRSETVGDLDVLLQTRDRSATTRHLEQLPALDRILARGAEKLSLRLVGGLQVDFRFVDAEAYGAALLYFTGSKQHNVRLRARVRAAEGKLSEYGLFEGERRVAGASEEEVYAALKLPWIPPELREDRGEIEAAEKKTLPDLVRLEDLRGDLHAHTTASDGNESAASMAAGAAARGYEYLAITDHTTAIPVLEGLDDAAALKQADLLHELNARGDLPVLLTGAEVDIRRDGELDLELDTLQRLDWVVASVHTHFGMDEKEMTARLLGAIRSGAIHCLGHPLGRRIGRREGLHYDVETIFRACLEHDVALEVNGQPDRLDLPDTYCQLARAMGLKFSLASDAHSTDSLGFVRWSVDTARRGWIEAKDTLNCLPLDDLRAWLGRARR